MGLSWQAADPCGVAFLGVKSGFGAGRLSPWSSHQQPNVLPGSSMCPFSLSQEEASRDQADRKGSEDMDGSEAEMAAEEGNIYLLYFGKENACPCGGAFQS